MWLFAFWNFALTSVSVIFGIRKIKYDLSWWSIIFPNAGLTIALINIGKALGSPAIADVCSTITVMLCVAWLVVATSTVRAVWQNKVLYPGLDEDEEDVEGHEHVDDEEDRRKQRRD